jgi:Ca2+-binding EF-hand superfamily protein
MAIDPDPSRPDFNDVAARLNLNMVGGKGVPLAPGIPPPPPGGPPGGKIPLGVPGPPGAPKVHNELQIKQEKKKFIEKFVKQEGINPQSLSDTFKKYQLMKEPTGYISFEDFMKLFKVEFSGEYKHLFDLYADAANGNKMNIREFLLGVGNFTTTDYKAKIEFVFQMFDEDKNGFLVMDELLKVK